MALEDKRDSVKLGKASALGGIAMGRYPEKYKKMGEFNAFISSQLQE
ncbi:MAG: hypothetical protein ACOX8Q_09185 [Christensenellales bacterium]